MYTKSRHSLLARIALLCSAAVLVFTKESAADGRGPLQHRIVQGKAKPIEDAPYTVQVTYGKYGIHLCGGSLVSNQFVVTAAHCLWRTNSFNLVVIAGTEKIGNIIEGTNANVSEIYIHPQYVDETDITKMQHPELYPLDLHMDVAVLKLEKPIEFSDTIQPIKMCTSPVTPKQIITILGWGHTKFNGEKSKVLMSIDVPVKSQYECIKMHQDSLTKITGSMVCAGYEGGMDACGGDSGGPAVRMGELCGIVSWGVGCGHESHVGVYTSIPVVRSFIDKCMQGKIKPIRSERRT